MVPVTSQPPHLISKEIRRYTPMTFSNHLQTYGHSIFELSTPQISRRPNPHRYIRQSQTSHTTLSMTVCRETAPLPLQTQPPRASRDFSTPTTTCHSISRTFDPIQLPTSKQLTSSGHLIMMHQACC